MGEETWVVMEQSPPQEGYFSLFPYTVCMLYVFWYIHMCMLAGAMEMVHCTSILLVWSRKEDLWGCPYAVKVIPCKQTTQTVLCCMVLIIIIGARLRHCRPLDYGFCQPICHRTVRSYQIGHNMYNKYLLETSDGWGPWAIGIVSQYAAWLWGRIRLGIMCLTNIFSRHQIVKVPGPQGVP